LRLPGTTLALLLIACAQVGGVEQGSAGSPRTPESIEAEAAILISEGRPAEAADLFMEAAAARLPGDPARFDDAMQAALTGRYPDSLCSAILTERPSDTTALLMAIRSGGAAACPHVVDLLDTTYAHRYVALLAAESLLASGLAGPALSALEAAVAESLPPPASSDARVLLYHVLLMSGDLPAATLVRQEAARSGDSILQARMLNTLGFWRLDNGLEGWEEALCSSMELWPAGDIHRGAWLVLRERALSDSVLASRLSDPLYSGGLWNELFDLAVNGSPSSAHVIYLAGRTRDRLGFYKQACDLLATYLRRWPDGPDSEAALVNLALDVARGGDPDSGLSLLDAWETRWAASPRIGNTPWYRGSILAENGRWSEALPHFRAMLDRYPSNVTADDSQFFLCLGLLALDRPAEAEEQLEAFLSRWSESVYAHSAAYLLGRIRWQEMNDPAGLDDLDRLVREHPETLPAAFARAALGEQPPDVIALDVPLESWMEAAGITPAEPPASAMTGLVLQEAGLRRWASGEFRRAEAEAGGAEYLASFYLANDVWERMPSAGWRLASRASQPWPAGLWRLRYPAAWPDEVMMSCSRWGFDPLITWSIMRQESMFQPWCYSPAGARGLIQMIPSTSEILADSMGWSGYSPDRLYMPSVSLEYGVCYLSGVAGDGGSLCNLLASYNGGPHNADGRWGGKELADDSFFQRITFNETRLYVEKVFDNYRVYRQLYPEYAGMAQERFTRPLTLSVRAGR
jgi:soluble lytic murein transglycosylase